MSWYTSYKPYKWNFTAQKGKGDREKRTSDRARTRDLRSIAEFQPREPRRPAEILRPPSPLCTGHRCAAIQRRLRPAPRGWYCVLCAFVLGWNDCRGVNPYQDRRTPGESFHPRTEGRQWSNSVLGWNNSRGVILSWNRTTPGESICPGMELLKGSHSVLGWNDSWGVLLSWDRTTPLESFCHWMEGLQGSHSVLDGTTPGETFCLGMERLQGSHSVLGWNDSRGVLLSWDGTTPRESVQVERLQQSHSVLGWNDTRESFSPVMERLQGRHSVLVKRLQGSPSVLGYNNPRGVILS